MPPRPLGGNTGLIFYWLPAIYPLRPVGPHSRATYGRRCTRAFHPPVHGTSSQGSPPLRRRRRGAGGGTSARGHTSGSTHAYARAITGEAPGPPPASVKVTIWASQSTTHNTTQTKDETTSERCPQGWPPATPSYQALFSSGDFVISDWP